MKKFTAIFLCFIMLFACSQAAFASDGECGCGVFPIVTVRGFGAAMQVENEDGTYSDLFLPDKDELTSFAKAEVKKLVNIALKKDTGTFVSEFYKTLDLFLGNMKCDSNGNSVKKLVVFGTDELTEDRHSEGNFGAVSRGTSGSDYVFEYDYRLDPLENADKLNDFIKDVKTLTHHGKVNIVAHSEGGCVTGAYLAKYGSADVNRTVFVASAVNGISLIGSTFTKEVTAWDKADALENFTASVIGFDGVNEFINLLISALNKAGILDIVTSSIALLLDTTIDGLYKDYLVDMFGTMPGLWSFVPAEYYEKAKSVMFGGDPKYDLLCEKLDNYQNTVRKPINSVLEKAVEDGMTLAICSGYGISNIPLSKSEPRNSDFLIDTKYTSFGATAAPFGEKLENISGRYVSPDGIVDASTCAFPDYTWFVKYQNHNDFCEAFTGFINLLLAYDGQPDVNSVDGNGQFIMCDSHEKMIPVSPDDDIMNQGSFAERLLRAVIKLFKLAFSEIVKLISG